MIMMVVHITSAMLSILGRAGATLLVAYELHALYI